MVNPLCTLFLFIHDAEMSEYSVLFKTGDDLRQDQLVMQLIALMDRLLKNENLDLNLVHYKVNSTHRIMQLIKGIGD